MLTGTTTDDLLAGWSVSTLPQQRLEPERRPPSILARACRQTTGKPEFVPTEDCPNGLPKLGDATADLNGPSFADGTIEYDAQPLGGGFASFRFRTAEPIAPALPLAAGRTSPAYRCRKQPTNSGR